jgi:hypothetical protein
VNVDDSIFSGIQPRSVSRVWLHIVYLSEYIILAENEVSISRARSDVTDAAHISASIMCKLRISTSGQRRLEIFTDSAS